MVIQVKYLGFRLKLLFTVWFLLVPHNYQCVGEHIAVTINFVKSSFDELCTPNLPNWVTNYQLENDQNHFKAYETSFRKYCKKIKPFLLEGNFVLQPFASTLQHFDIMQHNLLHNLSKGSHQVFLRCSNILWNKTTCSWRHTVHWATSYK